MTPRGLTYAVALALLGPAVYAASSHVFLFESAKARTEVTVTRQKARLTLAERELARMRVLYARHAVSLDELDQIRAAEAVAREDVRIAELRAKSAAISLTLAQALDRNGQRIPLCKRKRLKYDDLAVKLLKLEKRKELKAPEEPQNGTGTRIDLREAEAPEPPPTPDPKPPDPPDPPSTPGTPTGPGDPGDPGEIPTTPRPGATPKPAPKPGAQPGPAPGPKPGAQPAPQPAPSPRPGPRPSPK